MIKCETCGRDADMCITEGPVYNGCIDVFTLHCMKILTYESHQAYVKSKYRAKYYKTDNDIFLSRSKK